MMSLISECPVNIVKTKCHNLNGVSFFFRKTKTVTEVYEVSTKKLVLVSTRSNDLILNFLYERIDYIKSALNV